MEPTVRTLGGAHGLVILAALASLATGIVWSLDAATATERWQETRLVDPWAERGAFTYEPILADGSGALPMSEPGYFTTDAPALRVRFVWTLDDAGAERATAVGSLRLVVAQEGGSGRPAWTHEEPLAEATLAGSADEPLVLAGEVDLTAVEAKIAETPRRDASGAQWTFVARVRFESAPVEHHRSDASEYMLPLTYAPPLYVLPNESDATTSKDHTAREVVPHESQPGVRALIARPLGPALALLGAAALAYALPRAWRDEEVAP